MRRVTLLATAAALFGAASAHADSSAVVFPPTDIGLQVGSTFAFGPGLVKVGNDEAIGGVTVGGPFVTAEGSPPPTGFQSQTVYVTASWHFEVIGPPSTSVGILFGGVYDASTSSEGAAAAGILTGDNSLRDLHAVYGKQCSFGLGDCSQQLFSIETAVSSNFQQIVEIYATGAVTGPQGDFSVTLDPLISLAPAFAEEGYSLFVAPDAQPPATAGVPEPATWALMIGGFGLAGAGLRRRRRTLATTA